MKIASMSVSPFVPACLPKLNEFVADPTHRVAFSSDLAAQLGIKPISTLQLGNAITLHASPAATAAAKTDTVAAGNVLKLTETATKAGVLGLELIRTQFPGAGTDGAIQGMELVALSAAAAKAWTETGEKGYTKAVLTTASAALELVKLLKPFLPAIDRFGPQIATVSIVLKLTDTAYQVRLDYREIAKSTAAK